MQVNRNRDRNGADGGCLWGMTAEPVAGDGGAMRKVKRERVWDHHVLYESGARRGAWAINPWGERGPRRAP